jgi:hypothetical protein
LDSLVDELLQLRRGVLLDRLQHGQHMIVQHELLAHEGHVEFGSLVLREHLLRELDLAAPGIGVNRHQAAVLPGHLRMGRIGVGSLRACGSASGLRRFGSLGSSGGLSRTAGLVGAGGGLALPLLPAEGDRLQLLNELSVVANHHLGELPDAVALGALLGELVQRHLSGVVDDQEAGDLPIVDAPAPGLGLALIALSGRRRRILSGALSRTEGR